MTLPGRARSGGAPDAARDTTPQFPYRDYDFATGVSGPAPFTTTTRFNADGVVDSTEPNPSVTYDQNGNFAPALRVTDSTGRSATAAAHVVVGNRPPVLTFVTPQFGDPFEFGQTLSYEVSVSDNEPIDCARVQVQYLLGHDTHAHSLSTAQGCTGSFTTVLDAGHQGAANIAAVLVAQYTDAPSQAPAP